ncbi:uncharacterized protein DUF3822 [Breznakibacter xylanolyticus]|uniref:Uncharacterized protein DUF3822 n=1 Tax=Breznakibacter xylanolyticus TaxID=990 RepID=A0A2W7NXA5_9BACT|nr:DUF3822 family protein [Breznakibacter xylanolyticus]PZX17916.1 uncharacterized protein DUF3822 [Breznakibacter xylanolyticus]
MDQFSVVDESFDSQLSSSYYLSIRIAPDGFSFCVLDPIYNRFILFKEGRFKKIDGHWQQTIALLRNEPLFLLGFKRKTIVIENDPIALVPNALYRPENAGELIDGTYAVDRTGMHILENPMRMVDAVNLFMVPDTLHGVIRDLFPDVRMLHHVTPLLEATMLDDYSSPERHFVHLYFRHGVFDVLVMGQRDLKLINRFSFSDDNEVVYYLLFVFEQLKLQPGKTDVIVAGDIDLLAARFLLLKSYFKTVKMAVLPSHFQVADALLSVSLGRHLLLFNSFLCV